MCAVRPLLVKMLWNKKKKAAKAAAGASHVAQYAYYSITSIGVSLATVNTRCKQIVASAAANSANIAIQASTQATSRAALSMQVAAQKLACICARKAVLSAQTSAKVTATLIAAIAANNMSLYVLSKIPSLFSSNAALAASYATIQVQHVQHIFSALLCCCVVALLLCALCFACCAL